MFPFVIILIFLAASALAAATYFGLERLGRRGILPMACRTVAWTALGLLLVNVSCAVTDQSQRPLVLLDASLSAAADSAAWIARLDSLQATAMVRTFGDERSGDEPLPFRGRSLIRPALVSAAATGRQVLVITDGEIEDAADLPPDLLQQVAVRVIPRSVDSDLAIGDVDAPDRVTTGDTIRIKAEVRGTPDRDTATVEVRKGTSLLGREDVNLDRGRGTLTFRIPAARLQTGPAVLSVGLASNEDDEPRDDERHLLVHITAAPGVVLLANPPDWDSRFLFRTLQDVAQLPTRGYVQLTSDRWWNMETLSPVPAALVRRAASGADILVLKGETGQLAETTGAGGLINWVSGENEAAVMTGDWYVAAGPASPVTAALAGLPLDSFPPLVQVTPVQAPEDSWIGLLAREGRRGAARPVFTGRINKGRREITIAGDGLWRWAFRGGSSEQAYRSLIAASVTWLLGGPDSTSGVARPVRPVVARARPVVFEWTGPGNPVPVAATFTDSSGQHPDTLRFDGNGLAHIWLSPGSWMYRLSQGGSGTVVVDTWSPEWLPGEVTLPPRDAVARAGLSPSPARSWLWLFALAILALAAEWLARRRLGLR